MKHYPCNTDVINFRLRAMSALASIDTHWRMKGAYQVSNGKERNFVGSQFQVTCALLAAVTRIASQEGCLRGAFSASRRCSHAWASSSAGALMESDQEIILI
jgi:hypothetical protein